MKSRLYTLVTGLIFVALFFIFTFLVRSDNLRAFDFNMTVKIQDHIPQRGYRYLELIGEFPRFEIITGLIILFLIMLRQWWQMIIVMGTYVGAHLLELIGKLILSQPPPPFMFYKLQNQNNVWFPANYVAEGNSYPSGHSLRAFFFAVLICMFIACIKKFPLFIKIGIMGIVLLAAGLVALAKVAMGQHWTTDVIAGCLLGIGTALISVAFMNLSVKNKFFKKIWTAAATETQKD